MTLSNGLPITNEFDQSYRLTNSDSGEFHNGTYDYYTTGNIKTITDNFETVAS